MNLLNLLLDFKLMNYGLCFELMFYASAVKLKSVYLLLVTNHIVVGFIYLIMLFDMIGGSILVTSRLQAVVLRMVDFGGVTDWYQSHWL